MKKMFLAAGLALFLCVNIAGAEVFTLKSDQIGGQLTIDQVYSGFGCTGKNISPQLTWMNAPKNTKSFAITVYDPDAPTGSGWWHWVIFNIPADTAGLGAADIDQVYSGFGCTGKNISPQLTWMNAPKNAKSFAITVYDPDAPTGSGWWHWVIFNIPADTAGLVTDAGNPQKNLAPKGSVQSMTDYGKPGFGGACPPQGDKPHRYIFTVFALDVPKLDLDEKANAALVGFMLNGHAIEKASLISYYGR